MKLFTRRRRLSLLMGLIISALFIELLHSLIGRLVWSGVNLATFTAGLYLVLDWFLLHEYQTRRQLGLGLTVMAIGTMLFIQNYP